MTTIAETSAGSARISLVSLLGAIILFLLPWTDVTCGSVHLASQSGLQATYGGMTFDASFEEAGKSLPDANVKFKEKASGSASAIVSVALFVVIAAAVLASIPVLLKTTPPLHPGVLSLVAVILLAVQAIVGFPIERDVKKGDAASPGGIKEKNADAAMVGVTRTPWFWFECVALVLPTALFVSERRKKPGGRGAPG